MGLYVETFLSLSLRSRMSCRIEEKRKEKAGRIEKEKRGRKEGEGRSFVSFQLLGLASPVER